MSAARLRLWLPLLFLSLTAGPAAGDSELRVIALKHRLATEVVAAVQPLLGPGESVSSVDNKLIVRAAPRTLAQIERLLADVDVPRRNLRISVRHSETRDTSRERGGVSGDVHSGNTRLIIGGDRSRDGGLTVRRRGPEGDVQLHTERRVTTASDSTIHTLMVLDGGRAYLRVGESIPQVEPYLVLIGPRLAGLTAGVRFRDVTSGFEVEPRMLGDRIRLAIHPRLTFRSDRGMETVNLQELRTEVTVTPGEWVDLGGVLESANELNRHILGSAQRTTGGETRFLVRVDPL